MYFIFINLHIIQYIIYILLLPLYKKLKIVYGTKPYVSPHILLIFGKVKCNLNLQEVEKKNLFM
jgi:hypothetical protein